jgi:hypothetical protein
MTPLFIPSPEAVKLTVTDFPLFRIGIQLFYAFFQRLPVGFQRIKSLYTLALATVTADT